MKSLFLYMVRNGLFIEANFGRINMPDRAELVSFVHEGAVTLDAQFIGKTWDENYFTKMSTAIAAADLWIPNCNHPDYPSPDASLIKLIQALRPAFEKLNIDIGEYWPAFDKPDDRIFQRKPPAEYKKLSPILPGEPTFTIRAKDNFSIQALHTLEVLYTIDSSVIEWFKEWRSANSDKCKDPD